MNYSPNDPAYYRDKALEYAKKGKEVYSTQQDKNKQQMGYEIFKKGIQFMIQYAKSNIFVFLPSILSGKKQGHS
jgi:hypothetical protein